MVEAAERKGACRPGVDPRRVVVGKPRRGAQHDRCEQGLPVPVRDRLALQPGDPAADGGVGRQRARRHRARPGRRAARRADRLHPALCAADDRYVWLNQYTNPNAWKAHYRTTAPAIAREFPRPGRAVRRRRHHRHPDGLRPLLPRAAPPVRVVAVDPVGSVSFGGAGGPPDDPRPGHGVRPPLLDETYIDDVVHVEEPDTVRACHRLARRGFLFGGSTGTVVSGAVDWLAATRRGRPHRRRARPGPRRALPRHHLPGQLGGDLYGDDVLRPAELTSGARVAVRCPPSSVPTSTATASIVQSLGRGARRRPGGRTGLARRPLLRRPGRGLDAHGPVLRPGPQACRPAVGVDQGRLPAPHDHAAWRRRSHRPRPTPSSGRSPRCWPRSGYRTGVGRRPLLRRPGRRLDGHGPVLRPGPQATTCRRSRSRTSTGTRRSGAWRRRSPRPLPADGGRAVGYAADADGTGEHAGSSSRAGCCSSCSSSATPTSPQDLRRWASCGSPPAGA